MSANEHGGLMQLRGTVPMRLRDVDPAINEITGDVVDGAIEVQRNLGTRLLEKPYALALAHELKLRGRNAVTQVRCPATYKGVELKEAYVIDILVEDTVVTELKTVDALVDEHFGQLSTYLRFAQKPVGFLINFRQFPIKDGMHRLAGPRKPSVASGSP